MKNIAKFLDKTFRCDDSIYDSEFIEYEGDLYKWSDYHTDNPNVPVFIKYDGDISDDYGIYIVSPSDIEID